MNFLPSADLWTRIQRNFARLEEEKYYPHNVYQRAKEHEKWPGDTEGRTLLAWVLLAQVAGRPPRYLADMLALWPAEVNERGYFGKIYTDGISEQQLSSHGWVLQALAELHRAAQAGHPWATPHDARALALPILENLFLPTAATYADYPIDPAERGSAGAYSGSPDLAFSVYESHWCCTMRGAEGLYRLSQFQVVENPDGSLALPFLLPGDYHNGTRRLRIESTYPLASDFALRNCGSAPLILRLYLPAWIVGLPGRDASGWLTLTLAPGETRTLSGTLSETTRPLLPATLAYIARHPVDLSPAPADCRVHTRGPLILAKLPAHLDEQGTAGLRPIYQAYLDGITHKAHSSRRLLCQNID